MKNSDIQDAIANKIDKNIPTYKIKDDVNKKDIQDETIFINVRPLKTYMYSKDKNKLTNVTITYKTKIMTHENNLEVMDKLENLFGEQLNVNGRYLTIENLDFVEGDDFLSCNFTLDYFDSKNTEFNDDKTTTQKMQDLILRNK